MIQGKDCFVALLLAMTLYMQEDLINFSQCTRFQTDDIFIAGRHADRCQVFLGSNGVYTRVCSVPRKVGVASVADVQGYCRDLNVSPYLYEFTTPSFPIAVFATIVLYFFLRHLVKAASEPRRQPINPDEYREPSKRNLRFPRS